MFDDCGFGVAQDLCAICTDFIISELWTSNFLAYQVRILLLFGLVVVGVSCGFFIYFLGLFSGVCGESRLWNTRGTCEKCLLGLPLSKWCD